MVEQDTKRRCCRESDCYRVWRRVHCL